MTYEMNVVNNVMENTLGTMFVTSLTSLRIKAILLFKKCYHRIVALEQNQFILSETVPRLP